MIPHQEKGRGVTGALRYVMGQGNDAETKERLTLGEGEKSRAQILGGQNFGFEIESADDIELARRMMEWNGKAENQASKTRKLDMDCFHASLSWGDGEKPDRAQMVEAAQSYLKAMGLEKAQAVFVAHDDTDHAHIHIVASRIDPEKGLTLRKDYDKIEGQKWAVQWEKEHGQQRNAGAGKNLHGLIDAVQSRDVNALLAHLTRDKPTFQISEISRALAYGSFSQDERAQFRANILGSKNVIGLRETAEAPVTRYTTREILAAEMSVQRDAGALADDKRHGIKAARVENAVAKFTLKPEQAKALRHLTGAEGFAVLYGEAGTGKSHTLKAVRSLYEAEGKDVIGLAFTNKVVKGMRADGFEANTITSEMLALEKGRTSWNAKSVIVVDEAAMLSTENLARVTAAAKKAGAKLIVAGDDKQLTSVASAGGMFERLRQDHGAAILKEIQRNPDVEQKAAFNQMHNYDFLPALKTFEKKGFIHWTTRQSDTLKKMAERYTADAEAAPEKSRFMFAQTNKEVDTLNQLARALRKERGHLGEDHTLKTATGERQFATGDRIQFTANGRTKQEKAAGLVNGGVGTVRGIDIDKQSRAIVTVELDAAKGATPQRVSFVVGDDEKSEFNFNSLKHGFAGTVYRGQGDTLDVPYVGHSAQFRGRAAYVALSRHREEVHVFAARETVQTLEAMAAGMARTDNKRAASVYQIDAPSAARADLDKAVQEYQPPPASQSLPQVGVSISHTVGAPAQTASAEAPAVAQQPPTFAEAATATVETVEQKQDRFIADIEALRIELQQQNEIAASVALKNLGEAASASDPASSAGQPIAPQEQATFAEAATETIATVEQIAARAEAKEDRLIADTFAYAPETPTGEDASVAGDIAHAQAERALEALAGVANASAEPPAHAPQEATGEAASAGDIPVEVSAGRVLDALGGMAGGVARLAEGVAEFAEGAIDALAGLFGGGSSAPTPKAAPPEAPPPPKRRLSAEEYVAQEIEQRKAERREIARQLGAGEAMTEDELRMEKEAQEKRRDRGGGQSR